MIRFLLSLAKPYRGHAVIALIFQVLQTACLVVIPALNASVIDVGVATGDVGYILMRGLLMFVLSIAQLGFFGVAVVEGNRAALLIARDLRSRMYETILSFSGKEIASFGAPTLITRATNDIDKISNFFSHGFTVFLTMPLTFVAGVVMALIQNLALSAVIVVTVPVILLIAFLYIRKIVPYFRQRQRLVDDINGVLRDQISGVRVVKAFDKESFEKRKFDRVNLDIKDLNVAVSKLMALMNPIFTLVVSLATVGLLWYGGFLAEANVVGVGEIISFITYLSLILSSVLMSAMIFIMVPQVQISTERVMEILGTRSSVADLKDPAALGAPAATIAFEHVSYSYAPEDPETAPVLDDVNFEARPGQTTAIIGSTGSGKTTLLRLIPRLADATRGTVRIEGREITTLSRQELDSYIGYVPQKSFLFKGTIASNLRLAKPDATNEELWEALEVAQAAGFVHNLKEGLDAEVAEGGTNFSGGQRQRLAIARAVVRKPSIYLFDDSFSALDYTTDRKLREALRAFSKHATIVVIAQRVSSIQGAEQIVVLNNGAVDGIGTHSELLKTSETYREIVASQPTKDGGKEAYRG